MRYFGPIFRLSSITLPMLLSFQLSGYVLSPCESRMYSLRHTWEPAAVIVARDIAQNEEIENDVSMLALFNLAAGEPVFTDCDCCAVDCPRS